MTTIKIQYTYTPDLVRNLYTEQSRRADGVTIELQESQLTPAARAALLDGVGYDYGYGDTRMILSAERASLPQIVSLASSRHVELAVPDPVGAEPDVTRAVRDAEALLVALAAHAPERRAAWDAESARRDAIAAEKARLEADARNAAEAAADAAKRAEQRVAATAWIAEHATDLAARHAEGLLPTPELLARVRDHVFAAIDAPRYEKITRADLWHSDECCESAPEFVTEPATDLTAGEYETLVRVRTKAPEGATVGVREHRGWCDTCNGGERNERDVVRRSALVTVTALGRTLSREYSLS